MEPDFVALRHEFPVLERKTYLNSGSYSALANDVKAAIEAYVDDRLAGGANWDVWITKNETVRAVTHVCFRNGAKLEIPEIVRIARAKGAIVLLDCYQSVGSTDINVKTLDVDFAVGGTLKYLLGTAGLGFMYVRDSFTKSLVPTN